MTALHARALSLWHYLRKVASHDPALFTASLLIGIVNGLLEGVGLFLLVPFWVLKAAFVHPAPGRLLMTVFAYIMVIKGIVLVWSPYVYRKQLERVSRNTALRNFSLLALKRFDVRYDFMASRSTDVVELVRRVPWSISFITQGDHTVHEALKTLRIDGRAPEDSEYPFHQDFSFVLNGEPRGASKKLIDFYFSEKGQELLRKKGLTPVTR